MPKILPEKAEASTPDPQQVSAVSFFASVPTVLDHDQWMQEVAQPGSPMIALTVAPLIKREAVAAIETRVAAPADDAPADKVSLLSVLPHPYLLPMKHGGNGEVDPVYWGLTVDQFDQFMQACQRIDCWALLASHEHQYKTAGHVDAYQLNTEFVKPWSASTGCSVSLLMNEEPLAATVMLSHGWGEDIEQVQRMLQEAVTIGTLTSTTVIWFCVLSNYQPEDGHGPSISEQLAMDPFGKVIASADSMLVLHTTTQEVYGRLWCAYECDAAVASQGPEFVKHLHSIEFVAEKCEAEKNRVRKVVMQVAVVTVCLVISLFFIWGSVTGCDGVSTYFISSVLIFISLGIGACICGVHFMQFRPLQVDTEHSLCSRQEDTETITGIVQEHGGYERLNERIYELRMNAIRKVSPMCSYNAHECCGHGGTRCGDVMCGAPESRCAQCGLCCCWVIVFVIGFLGIFLLTFASNTC